MSSVYGSIVGLDDETFQFDKTIRIGATNMTTPRRYTVGDFDFLPTELEVDEDRYESDTGYCRAIEYMSEVSSVISRSAFNTNKEYRNAVNMLAEGSTDFSGNKQEIRDAWEVRGAWIRDE